VTNDYMEVVLTLIPGGNSDFVSSWFERWGITATPMRAGLLLTGGKADFESALGHHDPAFAIPSELKDNVSSIIWRPPPKLS